MGSGYSGEWHFATLRFYCHEDVGMENAIVAALSAFPPQLSARRNGAALKNDCIGEVFRPILSWQKGTNENLNGLLRFYHFCCSRHIKTKPGVVERQASQSSVLPFCSGIMLRKLSLTIPLYPPSEYLLFSRVRLRLPVHLHENRNIHRKRKSHDRAADGNEYIRHCRWDAHP